MAGDVKKLIAGATLPTATEDVCLHAGLVAQYEQLGRDLAAAQEAPGDDRLVGKSQTRQIAEQMEAMRQEMLESSITFELRALPRHRWQSLMDEHPPRRDGNGTVVDDDRPGVNAATFYDALIRRCTTSPDLDDDDWANLLGVHAEHEGPCRLDDPKVNNPDCPCREGALTSYQFDILWNKAWSLNRRNVSVPFSHAASAILRNSDSE